MRVESVLSEEERDRKFNKFKKMRGQSDVEMQPPQQQQQEPQPLQHHQQQQQQQLKTTTSSSPLNWTEMDLSSEPLVLTEESDLMRDVKVVVPKTTTRKEKKDFPRRTLACLPSAPTSAPIPPSSESTAC